MTSNPTEATREGVVRRYDMREFDHSIERYEDGSLVSYDDYEALRKVAEHHREGRLNALEHLAVATAEADALRSEVSRLRDDAARYRWMRDSAACSLSISHNDHHNMYLSVEDTMNDSQGYYDDVPLDEKDRMIVDDSIWTVHIYPNTPVGFNVYHAATLDAAIDQAMEDPTP